MSVFERLLLPGAQELPDCRCGTEMMHEGNEAIDAAEDVEILRLSMPGLPP